MLSHAFDLVIIGNRSAFLLQSAGVSSIGPDHVSSGSIGFHIHIV